MAASERQIMNIDISEISAAFPEFTVAAIVASDMTIGEERPPELGKLIAEREAACREEWGGKELSEIPGIAAWRRAYRQFGIKKTSYRSSVERLVKNTLASRALPAINSFVDSYNAASLGHILPAGADDLDHVVGDIAFRYSREDDSFLDMAGAGQGDGAPLNDPPKLGEVVYADAEKILCRRWNWRQDARTLVQPSTGRAIVTLQSNGVGNLDAAIDDLVGLIGWFCGGKTKVVIANRDRPIVAID